MNTLVQPRESRFLAMLDVGKGIAVSRLKSILCRAALVSKRTTEY